MQYLEVQDNMKPSDWILNVSDFNKGEKVKEQLKFYETAGKISNENY